MVQKIVSITAVLLIFCAFSSVSAQEAAKSTPDAFRSTEYPLPRFVSLSSDEAYVRSGPGRKYPILWVYKQRSIPVEIILEYDVWRKIHDFDGQKGWVHKSLLSGRRTGFIQNDGLVSLYKKPRKDSRVTAYLEPKLLVSISACEGGWCEVDAKEYSGWLEQSMIWGVYEGENFN
ncbi:MAG: hypothetical protein JKY71_05050 [Alphaproteobacteria bacterium]|nr:hypothetical protein [Alphaproteobacteria bacterium]